MAEVANENIRVRWLTGGDLEQVLEIERASREPDAWGREELDECLARRNTMGYVAVCGPGLGMIVVGYLILAKRTESVQIRRIVCDTCVTEPAAISAALFARVEKIVTDGRELVRRAVVLVDERELGSLNCFKGRGWKAVGIQPDDTPDGYDGIVMAFDRPGQPLPYDWKDEPWPDEPFAEDEDDDDDDFLGEELAC
jgi:hypothetical protein